MELSLEWAAKSKKFRRIGYGIFGIIQGGMFNDLRELCIKSYKKLILMVMHSVDCR